ncbi:Galactan endo-beta-1,3-galactanase [Sphagnurus paluster]|uniref:Galactan endo-beta-1,3-galactanase n=1 Tax=Sphagnurus paluster TaxID=117069 RepID=A0A9P7FN51_9AGAR|nr:Galactan endo-beta-1,3-galactanase [Sphagnurus paluster]
MFLRNLNSLVLVAVALVAVPSTQAATTVIPANSFSSYGALETYWNYLYPWGSDHNGSARMKGGPNDHTNIVVSGNTLSLIAKPISNPVPPTSTANPHPAIKYSSGAVHAKHLITVTAANGYTISGEFSAPTTRGTWPAFWLTGANSWPPEIDIGEWKGTPQNWFNTFNTSSSVRSDLVNWPSDLSFHSIKAVLTAQSNNRDIKIDFFVDNVYKATQFGLNFVGKPLWLWMDRLARLDPPLEQPTGFATS